MNRLHYKVALITGAARGIGAQIAKTMAHEGAEIFLADLLDELTDEVATEIQNSGGKATALHLNVVDEDSWTAGIREILKTAGRLDILVNNAGIILAKGFEEVSLQEWQKMVDVNMTSVFLGTKLCAPALRAAGEASAGGSSIINLSSIAGLVAAPNDPLYSMTKGGVTLFTKSSAISFAEKGDSIRVNSIHPGVIDTQMGEQVITAQAKRLGVTNAKKVHDLTAQRHPIGRIGRIGQTTDIANAALFLASDEAAFITGSNLVVDGGLTAQ